MKKLIYLATLASSMLLSTSCVDLTQEPQSFITQEDYMSSLDVTSLQKITGSLYSDLWSDNYGINCRMQSFNLAADDVMYRTAKANNRLEYLWKLSPDVMQNDADVKTMWNLLFKAISDANAIINKTQIPEDAKVAEQYRAVIGEAYFVRGFAYLYLVRLFGDVPLILTFEEAGNRMPRTAVADIFDKAIIPSLQKAAEWLPAKSRTNSPAAPTKWAAKMCMADAYMSMAGWPLKRQECYALAAQATKDIIDNAGLKLTAKYADLWKEANKTQTNEVMFALLHSVADKNASQYGKSYYPVDFYPNAGWADYYADEQFYLNYPNDERKAWNFMTEWPVNTGQKDADGKVITKIVNYKESADKLPAISKYYGFNDGNPGQSQLSNGMTCFYRYAEVLLTYAEASTRATGNVNAEALTAIQAVQKRAGYADASLTTTTNAAAFLQAVSNERGWEFFAEMKRLFELVRLEKFGDVKPAQWSQSLFKTQNHYYQPIPYLQIPLTGWNNNPGY